MASCGLASMELCPAGVAGGRGGTESNINQCFYDPGYRHVPLILKPLPGATPNGSLLKQRSVTAPGGYLSEVEEFLTTRQDAVRESDSSQRILHKF